VTELLVATNNPGKLAEFRRLLRSVEVPVVGPADIGLELDVPEPHDTYAENAAAKARAFCRASDRLTLADDSGIEVEALAWGPGVRSARFGGRDVTDNATFLLERLGDAADRRARMVCWLALGIPGDHDPQLELFSGTVEGQVARERRGSGGFGYDPIFLLPSGRTAAELAEEEKDELSHRGKAVACALPRIRQLVKGMQGEPRPSGVTAR
jgi:XTP/dITP diphosphohydrolase